MPLPVGAGAATGTDWIRLIFIFFGGLLGAGIGAVLIGGVLIYTGSPSPCVDREVPVSAQAEQAARDRWRAFKAQPPPATTSFTESEITSRGVTYVDEKSLPVEGLRVYFCPDGHAEAAGKITAGRDINVVVSGTLNLDGPNPEIAIDSVRAGNLPSFVATGIVNRVVGGAKRLNLGLQLSSVRFFDGRVELNSGAAPASSSGTSGQVPGPSGGTNTASLASLNSSALCSAVPAGWKTLDAFDFQIQIGGRTLEAGCTSGSVCEGQYCHAKAEFVRYKDSADAALAFDAEVKQDTVGAASTMPTKDVAIGDRGKSFQHFPSLIDASGPQGYWEAKFLRGPIVVSVTVDGSLKPENLPKLQAEAEAAAREIAPRLGAK